MSEVQRPKITLEVVLDDANRILSALAQRPYGEVAGLITNIQNQAQAQLNPPNLVEPDPVAE